MARTLTQFDESFRVVVTLHLPEIPEHTRAAFTTWDGCEIPEYTTPAVPPRDEVKIYGPYSTKRAATGQGTRAIREAARYRKGATGDLVIEKAGTIWTEVPA